MSKIVSEDSLRRALGRMSADQSRDWLRPQLLASVQAALDSPWILDIDTTVKTLFGKQRSAITHTSRAAPATHCILIS